MVAPLSSFVTVLPSITPLPSFVAAVLLSFVAALPSLVSALESFVAVFASLVASAV